MRPSNVVTIDRRIRLLSRSGSFDGAEIALTPHLRMGRVQARMSCVAPRGAVCAFFLYEVDAGPGSGADEIDIELLPGAGEVSVVTWVGGVRTNHATIQRPRGFDMSDLHDYSIVRTEGSVEFLIDDERVARFDSDLPTSATRPLVNLWWPEWLRSSPHAGARIDVDWVRIEPS